MAVDPQVYDDKMLEIINSLQIQPSLEEQLGIGSMDLLAPSWNLPGGPEGGIYPLMPGMEYAPTMATAPIIAPPPPGGPPPPPEVIIDDPDDPPLGPITGEPIGGPPITGEPPVFTDDDLFLQGPVVSPGGDSGGISNLPELTPEFIQMLDNIGASIPEITSDREDLDAMLDEISGGMDLPDNFFLPELTPEFMETLDEIGTSIPEITSNREEMDRMINEISEGMDLPDDFFGSQHEGSSRDMVRNILGITSGLIPGFGRDILENVIDIPLGGIGALIRAVPGGDRAIDWLDRGVGRARDWVADRPILGGIADFLEDPIETLRGLRERNEEIGDDLETENTSWWDTLSDLGGSVYGGGTGLFGGRLRRGMRRILGLGPPGGAEGGIANVYPRVNALIEGPGTEKSDDIKAMLSDGEFVTNAAALRGIGRLNGADPKDKEEQRRMGAREMYRLQHAGEKAAGVA